MTTDTPTHRTVAVTIMGLLLVTTLLFQAPALATNTPLVAGSNDTVNSQHEPNDEFDTATNISTPYEQFNLQTSFNDTDIYAVTLQPGTQLTVSVGFSHAEGNIDLYIADPHRDRIQANTSITDGESITFHPGKAGTYYIAVVGWADTPTTYSLTVTGDTQPIPQNDALEYNNGFTSATPISLPYDRAELHITPTESDFYTVQIPAEHQVTLTAQFNHSQADINLHLYNQTHALVRTAYSATSNETITFTTEETTTLYLEVYAADTNSAFYQLAIASQPIEDITTTTTTSSNETTTITTPPSTTTTGGDGPGFTILTTILALLIGITGIRLHHR